MAAARYGDRVGALEPYSIEHVPLAERHGRGRDLLWLWLAANLTIADYALGFLPVSLGLPLGPTLLALALGNLLGGALLALCAAMGPRAGFPQMLIGRRAFGHLGGYGPALLNWVSTVGWFTVNTILGAFAVQVLLPGLPLSVKGPPFNEGPLHFVEPLLGRGCRRRRAGAGVKVERPEQ